MSDPAAQLRRLLTKRDVADHLQVSVRQIDLMVKSKQFLPPIYISKGAPRWRPEDLDAYFEAKRTATLTLGSN